MNNSLKGKVSVCTHLGGSESMPSASFENKVMDVLIALDIAPVILDGDGAVLTTDSGAVLLNM